MKKSRCSILGIEKMEDQKKMAKLRPPRLQPHNTIIIIIFFHTLLTYTTLLTLFTYYFTYLLCYFIIHLLIYVVNYNLSIYIYLHYHF